jgi:type II secretory ATPase GspE/PulE/Tfp pilus assembly ATPase PilB-like protein
MKQDDTKRKAEGAGQDDAEAARTVNEILHGAVRGRASDVHLESLQGGRMRVRHRIDGVLHEAQVLPEGAAEGIVARVKTMAGLDVAERRLPQDGRISLRVDGRDYDIRLSTLPVLHGERVTLRILRPEVLDLRLERIGLTEENLATVRRLCQAPHGIVVVNGPTGCGKTTLLYSMLQEVDQVRESVMTVEDPVEYSFERVSQVQIRPEIGLTFARAIRSMLRQDPDVILVGEIRDRETLELCVQVAMTGHLVLTTLHATTSAEAVRRMLDIGLPPFMVNAGLKAVISQRLIRRLCPECRQPETAGEEGLAEEARAIVRRLGQVTWYGPKGCEACSRTGYLGRTSTHEVLVMNDRIQQVVSGDGTAGQIREAAIGSGMKTMLEDGLAKAAQGVTSVREVLRVAPQGTYQ